MEAVGCVADTGPLVAFAKVAQLELLQQLFGAILIPPAVEQELFAKRSTETSRIEQILGDYLHVADKPVISSEVQSVTRNLGHGEAEAVALAYNRQLRLIVDDALGRKAAIRLQLQFAGSVGLVVEAKRRGYVTSILPILLEMRNKGYWLADDLIRQAAALAGELE